jgi:hypothetical protein
MQWRAIRSAPAETILIHACRGEHDEKENRSRQAVDQRTEPEEISADIERNRIPEELLDRLVRGRWPAT